MKGNFINIVNKFLTTSGFFLTSNINQKQFYIFDYQYFRINRENKKSVESRVPNDLSLPPKINFKINVLRYYQIKSENVTILTFPQ
jgi:hypothetical protein